MEFKKLSDVEVVAEPTESANVLIEENGVIKKAHKTAVGGGIEWDAIIERYDTESRNYTRFILGDYNSLYNKIMVEKEPPKVKVILQYDLYGTCYSVNVADVIYAEYDDKIYIITHGSYDNSGQHEYCIKLYPDNRFDTDIA